MSMSNGQQQLPPSDQDAEKSVLGACLLNNAAIDDVQLILRPKHFYAETNGKAFRAICDLHDTGLKADAVTVGHELQKRGELEDFGGPTAIMDALERVPHAFHVEHYAKIVADQWMRRELLQRGHESIRTAHEAEDIAVGIREAETKLFALIERGDDRKPMGIRDVINETFEEIAKRMDKTDGELVGVPSGLIDLDKLTGGFSPGLIVLAARPSSGKTALACNMTIAAAKAGCPVLFVSLEQGRAELVERMLCSEAQADSMKLRMGDVSKEENIRLSEVVTQLRGYPIVIDDSPNSSPVVSIAAQARRAKRQHNIGMLIVDYLQLIEPEERKDNRDQEVATISKRLKFISKELDIPVIVLAQMNRGIEQRTDKVPRLSDIRESGSVEQDADLVIFIHRPELYDPDERPGEADLHLAKQRNGKTGIVTCVWFKEQMRFGDMAFKSLHDKGMF